MDRELIRLKKLEEYLYEGTINRIKDRVCEAWEKGIQRGIVYGLATSYAFDKILEYKLDSKLNTSISIPLTILTTFALSYVVGRIAENDELKKAVEEKTKIYPEDTQTLKEWKNLYHKFIHS